ncbi:MAG TPA: SDR family oxidoreductase [Thermoanaerobaculia bacterium]|nr:SDR family oxidoreductase [Thermoanaerobaculia bacterium]
MDISTARVLVTGGSSGIGLETARQLRARGARVAICGRNEARVKEAAAAIDAIAIAADVGNEADVVRLVRATVEQLGGYDTLINNAGFGHFAPLVETSLADMQRVYATNVFGAMLVARESAKHFIAEARGGNIVNVASTAGQRGFAGGTAYSSSKFALSGLTDCWRAELRNHDIRVMQINPSEVQTEFVTASGRPGRAFSERKLQAADIAHAIIAMLEMNDRGFVPEMSVWATNPD